MKIIKEIITIYFYILEEIKNNIKKLFLKIKQFFNTFSDGDIFGISLIIVFIIRKKIEKIVLMLI